MTHASLFSGIGGFDLAAEWAGFTNIFNCEIDPFCQKILKYHFPHAEQYSDIRTTDFAIWRDRIDVLSGGFPCQPFSVAGKRKGTEDERHLWPEMLRTIREIQPRWVVGENVLGIVNWSDGLVFEQVCADLEAEGYEVQPFVLPACCVDAPHRRDRVWFIAKNTQCVRRDGQQPEKESEKRGQRIVGTRDHGRICGKTRVAAHPTGERPQARVASGGRENEAKNGTGPVNRPERPCCKRSFTDCPDTGIESLRCERENTIHGFEITSNTDGCGLWEEINRIRESGLLDEAGTENNWQNFPTQSPVCSRNDGISIRLDGITFSKWRQESIKAYGNAIVPQVAYQIFETIKQIS